MLISVNFFQFFPQWRHIIFYLCLLLPGTELDIFKKYIKLQSCCLSIWGLPRPLSKRLFTHGLPQPWDIAFCWQLPGQPSHLGQPMSAHRTLSRKVTSQYLNPLNSQLTEHRDAPGNPSWAVMCILQCLLLSGKGNSPTQVILKATWR
jgi:hypothetical protein